VPKGTENTEKKMKKSFTILHIAVVMLSTAALHARVRVVTTSTDLASIAGSVGGTRVTVESLTAGNTDLHYVQARPDFIMKLNRTDLFIPVGLELEAGWVPLLLNQSRNPKIHKGAPGHCDAYIGIELLDKPAGEINRQMGDIHPYGNPHYWPDPVNGIVIARNIKESLGRVDPEGRDAYEANFARFKNEALAKMKEIAALFSPHRGKEVVVYHTEFSYLLRRLGLKQGMMIEELPGVAPSPSHARRVKEYIRSRRVPVVLVSPWSNVGFAGNIARESGARLLVLPVQTGSARGTENYLKMTETSARMLAEALSR